MQKGTCYVSFLLSGSYELQISGEIFPSFLSCYAALQVAVCCSQAVSVVDSGLGGFHLRGCLETKINVFFTQRNVFQGNKELKLCFADPVYFNITSCSAGEDGAHRLNPMGF